jgi:hypothetical protein
LAAPHTQAADVDTDTAAPVERAAAWSFAITEVAVPSCAVAVRSFAITAIIAAHHAYVSRADAMCSPAVSCAFTANR